MTPQARDFRARLRAHTAPASADAVPSTPPLLSSEAGAGASLSRTWISTPDEEREVRRIERRLRREEAVVAFCVVAIGTGLVALVVDLLGG